MAQALFDRPGRARHHRLRQRRRRVHCRQQIPGHPRGRLPRHLHRASGRRTRRHERAVPRRARHRLSVGAARSSTPSSTRSSPAKSAINGGSTRSSPSNGASLCVRSSPRRHVRDAQPSRRRPGQARLRTAPDLAARARHRSRATARTSPIGFGRSASRMAATCSSWPACLRSLASKARCRA